MIHNYQNFSSEIFPGFYDSFFSEIRCCDEIPEGFYYDVKDWKVYETEICKLWVQAMLENFNDNPINIQIKNFTSLDSPKEYNFRTDRINFDVQFDLQELCKYCFGTYKKEFDNYLRENWSSRSGFCSFIPNDIFRFKRRYSENIDIILEFYFLQNIDFQNVSLDVYENIYEAIDNAHPVIVDENYNMWDYEYNNETDSLTPTKQIA